MPTKQMTINGRPVTLDARPDRVDLRDLPYRPPVGCLDPIYPNPEKIAERLPKYLKSKLILDQKSEGACTGFGLAAIINYLLWLRSDCSLTVKDGVSPRMLYQLARFYDEWPGEDYEGSSCRGALKGWHRHGVCRETMWPYADGRFVRPEPGWEKDALCRPLGVYYRVDKQSVVDMQAAIFNTGGIYVSAGVHQGWEVKSEKLDPSHASLPVIKPSTQALGGHAFALVGYNEDGFVVQNSWGTKWGAHGFAILTYEDWVENGTDAWVMALGVPVSSGVRGQTRREEPGSPQYFVRPVETTTPIAGGGAWLGTAPDPLEGRPNTWSEQEAYWHTVVTGNDGYVINRLPHVENEADNVAWVGREQPRSWFRQQPASSVSRLVVYAHGGLNDEKSSIDRIRILGPCFKENDIYPVFTTWKSGWYEILADMLKDGVNKLFGGRALPERGITESLIEASDRALEVFLRGVFGKSIWSEMKENVARSADEKRGLDLLAANVARLSKEMRGKLEIHLIGHSAGSFVCGRLVSELAARKVKVNTCTLYAPACDVAFALEHFKEPIEADVLKRSDFHIYLLSQKNELDDTVGPYRKSLLYLVSRALERLHKTPLLGLETVFKAGHATKEYWHKQSVREVAQWQKFFSKSQTGEGGSHLVVLDKPQVNVGRRQIKSSHGCFDNSIEIMTATIKSIRGGDLRRQITDLDY